MCFAPFFHVGGEEVEDGVEEVVFSNELENKLCESIKAEVSPDLVLLKSVNGRVSLDGLELVDDCGGDDVSSEKATENEEHTNIEV